MRIAVGCIGQESQSFSPITGDWEHFGEDGILRGQAMLERLAGTSTELGGAIAAAADLDVQLVPTVYAMAAASAGRLRDSVFEQLAQELGAALDLAAGGIDGLLLILHGAMLTESNNDATGELLARLRLQLGEVPIVGSLDLHANVTERMGTAATALVGYRTFPHTDMAATAGRALRLLCSVVAGSARPAMVLRRLPMLVPPVACGTDSGPFAELQELARTAESKPCIIDVSLFPVQPWLDIPEVATTVLVTCTDTAGAAGAQVAEHMADAFWQRRRRLNVRAEPIDAAVADAVAAATHPVVIGDGADSTTSGSPGDCPDAIAALLAAAPRRDCLCNLVDRAAVATLFAAGEGAQLEVQLGAVAGTGRYAALRVSGTVERLFGTGTFIQTGPGFTGEQLDRGRVAVLRCGHVVVVLCELPVRQWDPEFYRSLGLDPAAAQVVIVKSPQGFRAAYRSFAARMVIADSRGISTSELAALPYRHVRRPLFPLDDPPHWRQQQGRRHLDDQSTTI